MEEENKRKKCKTCGKFSPANGNFCLHCGAPMNQEGRTSITPSVPKKKCPYCGKLTPENETFCVHCESYLEKPKQSKPVTQPMKNCYCCGLRIPASAIYCPYCNNSANPPYASPAYATTPPSTVLAIIGFIISFFQPIVGLILSIIAKNQAEDDRTYNFAQAGFIISIVSIVACVVSIVLYIIVYAYSLGTILLI